MRYQQEIRVSETEVEFLKQQFININFQNQDRISSQRPCGSKKPMRGKRETKILLKWWRKEIYVIKRG